jgi:hypothetical protein
MFIEIPKKYGHYVDMVVEAGIYADKKVAVTRIFEHGLNEAAFDAWVEGAQSMELGGSEEEQLTIEAPDEPEYQERLALIGRKHQITEGKVTTLCFLQGLLDHHLALEDSQLYKTDEIFRKKVDEMPTEIC